MLALARKFPSSGRSGPTPQAGFPPLPVAAIFWGLLIFSERGFGDCCANLWGDGHASHAEWIDMFSVLDASRRLPRP